MKPQAHYPRKAAPNRKERNVLAHRLRAERALGHPLPARSVVHHVNEQDWSATAPLVICEDQGYHKFLHYRARIVKAGGNPNTEKICSSCLAVLPLSAFYTMRRNQRRAWAAERHQSRCKDCASQRKLATKVMASHSCVLALTQE